jgi:hypothetical protein
VGEEPEGEEGCLDIPDISASRIVERSVEMGGTGESARNIGGAIPETRFSYKKTVENEKTYLKIELYHHRQEIDLNDPRSEMEDPSVMVYPSRSLNRMWTFERQTPPKESSFCQ